MLLRLLHRAGSIRRNRFGLALTGLALCAAIAFPTYLTTSSTYSRIRVLVATPDAGNVDVLINSIQLAANNKLGDLTTYTYRPSGRFGLRVFPPGMNDPGKALAAHNAVFEGGKDYTVIVYGKKADNSLDIVAEQDTNTPDTANAKVRFANYLPGSGTLALTAAGTAAGSAAFGKMSGAYATVPPTASGAPPATLAVTDASGAGITSANATFSANIVVTAFAIPGTGGAGATLLLSLDAGTPATPLNAVTAPAMPGTATTTTSSAATTAAPPATVTTAATGGNASAALRAALLQVPQITNTDTKVWYAATGHTLGGVFKTYWESHGGLEQFGYPITEEYQEVSATDGKTYTTQYFERARFEHHTDKAGTPYEVEQGLLGREMIRLLGAG